MHVDLVEMSASDAAAYATTVFLDVRLLFSYSFMVNIAVFDSDCLTSAVEEMPTASAIRCICHYDFR